MSTYAKNWLKKLVETKSITPDDGGLLDVISTELSAQGFETQRLDSHNVKNLVATRGTGPLVLFLGHVDVVPAAGSWRSEPFQLTERDDCYYGRGVADMKGAIAAFMAAQQDLELPFRLGIALTSDEEGEAEHGSRIIAEHFRNDPPIAVLVGEPSCDKMGDTIRVGRRGSLYGSLKLEGTASHVAYGTGDSAVVKLKDFLNDFYSVKWPNVAGFPDTIAHIVDIQSGVASNVVPPEAKVQMNWRFGCDPQLIQQQLSDYNIDYSLTSQPFLSTPGPLHSALQKAVQDITGSKPEDSTGGGTSDGRFFAPICSEVIEFGLPNGTIHKVDECIRICDFEALIKIYRAALQGLKNR